VCLTFSKIVGIGLLILSSLSAGALFGIAVSGCKKSSSHLTRRGKDETNIFLNSNSVFEDNSCMSKK
jgi:hypothetical protein